MKTWAVAFAAALAAAACTKGGEQAPSPAASHEVTSAPPPAPAPAAPPSGPKSPLAGAVTFSGTAPKLAGREVLKDATTCGKEKPQQRLRIGPGNGLADTVVWLDVPGAAPAPAKITIAQHACDYEPHVAAVPVGSTVTIENSDPILHNVHAAGAVAFNIAQPVKGQKNERPLDRAGVIHLKCDVHSWMEGWIVVENTPFIAVTGPDGRFELKDVPAGTYTLHAWHESWSPDEPEPVERSAQVTLPAAGPVAITFGP